MEKDCYIIDDYSACCPLCSLRHGKSPKGGERDIEIKLCEKCDIGLTKEQLANHLASVRSNQHLKKRTRQRKAASKNQTSSV